jgi:hypothetical protein
MDRALVYETKGYRFESCLAHTPPTRGVCFYWDERSTMKKLLILSLILIALLLTGCLAGADSHFDAETPAGFFAGVWHGLLAPFTLLADLFGANVSMYEAANVGPQYDLGFLIGFMMLFGVPTTIREIRRLR